VFISFRMGIRCSRRKLDVPKSYHLNYLRSKLNKVENAKSMANPHEHGFLIRPNSAFRPETESRGALSPIGTGSLPAKSDWPTAGGRGGSGRGASPDDGGSVGV
jgi:hypothetical protein